MIAWVPNAPAASVTRVGSFTAAEFTDTLSAPAAIMGAYVAHAAEAAADGVGQAKLLAGAAGEAHRGGAVVAGGRYIKEDDLIGTFGVIAVGKLDGVARVAQATS